MKQWAWWVVVFTLFSASALAASLGEIKITANISDASILVDGTPVAKTKQGQPVYLQIQTGTHEITVTRPGFTISTQQIMIEATSTREIYADIVRNAPGLEVRCNLEDCLVFLDDQELGKAPVFQDALELGNHTVRVEHDGYTTQEQIVSMTAPELHTLKIEMLSAYGSLLVNSTPKGATVTVDGRERGVTPLEMGNLPTGTHGLQVHLDGYADAFRSVRVRPAQTSQVNASLRTDSGTLIVKLRELEAKVLLNDAVVGKGPLELTNIEPGLYDLRITLEGYLDFQERIEVSNDKPEKLTIKMVPLGTALSEEMAAAQRKEKNKKRAWIPIVISLGVSAGLAAGGVALFGPQALLLDMPSDPGQIAGLPR